MIDMQTVNDKNFSFYKTIAKEAYRSKNIGKLFRTISQSMILIRKHKVVFEIFKNKDIGSETNEADSTAKKRTMVSL